MPPRPIEATLEELTRRLLGLPGIQGTALGECHGKPCILILANPDIDLSTLNLPETMDGHPIQIQPCGSIKPLKHSD